MKPLPQAPVTELRLTTDNGGGLQWLVRIQCPHCRKPPQHGGGTGVEPDLGLRGAYCVTSELRPDYILTVTDRTEISADRSTAYAVTRRTRSATRRLATAK